jgi:hypothetical protein
MAKTPKTHMVRDTQFVVDSLEEYADLLFPHDSQSAGTLKLAAVIYRDRPAKGLIHYAEREDANQAAARIIREATEKD